MFYTKSFIFFSLWLQPTFSAGPRKGNWVFLRKQVKPINSVWLYNNCSNNRIQNRGYGATKDLINHTMLVVALCYCAHSLHHAPIFLFLGVCSKLNKACASDDVSTFVGNLSYGDKRSLKLILFASWSLLLPPQYL